MPRRSYLDWNATTPLRASARDAMADALGCYGNPSSIHAEGRKARGLIEDARTKVAALVGTDPRDVVFTSGGTEANVQALIPPEPGAVLYVSAIEHPSVASGGRFPAAAVRRLAVTRDGVLDLGALAETLARHHVQDEGRPFIVACMLANNETGAIQPISEVAKQVREAGGVLHTDAVQAAGKIAIDLATLGADTISLSAHKLGGPKGVGALVLARGRTVKPLMVGGGQELRRRGGTENVPGIVGFGAAADEARDALPEFGRLAERRNRLEHRIAETAPDAVVFAHEAPRLPNTSCFAVPGMRSETLVIALDLAGIAASAGAACSSGKIEASPVLGAMGVDAGLGQGAVRVSMGRDTTDDEIDHFLAEWARLVREFKERRAAA